MPMALEERVKAVEDELGILKDQIRNTLLEIQEQILMRYYPELRAKDAPPPDLNWPASRGNGAGNAVPAFRGLQRVTIAPDEAPDSADAPQAVPDSAEPASGPAPAESGTAPAPPAADVSPKSDADLAMVTRLMDWASDAVQLIGRERTARAIEVCAQGGFIEPDVKNMLLQLIALSDGEPALVNASLRDIHDLLLKLNQALGRAGEDIAQAQWLMEAGSGG